jgi:hypothetical protein
MIVFLIYRLSSKMCNAWSYDFAFENGHSDLAPVLLSSDLDPNVDYPEVGCFPQTP